MACSAWKLRRFSYRSSNGKGAVLNVRSLLSSETLIDQLGFGVDLQVVPRLLISGAG